MDEHKRLVKPEGWRVKKPSYSDQQSPPSKKEVWKKWRDSPYEFSNLGHCRRIGSTELRKPRDDDRKHHRINLTWDGKREEPMLHQVIMELFGPPKPKGENIVILHKDNDGTNNAISNLKWGTKSQNTQQVWDDGLLKKSK